MLVFPKIFLVMITQQRDAAPNKLGFDRVLFFSITPLKSFLSAKHSSVTLRPIKLPTSWEFYFMLSLNCLKRKILFKRLITFYRFKGIAPFSRFFYGIIYPIHLCTECRDL